MWLRVCYVIVCECECDPVCTWTSQLKLRRRNAYVHHIEGALHVSSESETVVCGANTFVHEFHARRRWLPPARACARYVEQLGQKQRRWRSRNDTRRAFANAYRGCYVRACARACVWAQSAACARVAGAIAVAAARTDDACDGEESSGASSSSSLRARVSER